MMAEESNQTDPTRSPSTVYGPVKSWRVGWSLGIDPIQNVSTCSFDCLYCQLGRIVRKTTERRVFVPTERVAADLSAVDWSKIDVVTASGCGEPALAANLGEILRLVRERYSKPTVVLTNSFHFSDPAARADLAEADEVAAKLDVADDSMLALYNRPAKPTTVRRIVEGVKRFRAQYKGRLCTQTMLMRVNIKQAEAIARLIGEIGPDEAQLNTPRRFYPMVWRQENRGRHVEGPPDYAHRRLRTVPADEMRRLAQRIQEISGVKTTCVFPL